MIRYVKVTYYEITCGDCGVEWSMLHLPRSKKTMTCPYCGQRQTITEGK